MVTDETTFFWKAAPYTFRAIWHPGKIHRLRPPWHEKTRCGHQLADIGGEQLWEMDYYSEGDFCKKCTKSEEVERKWAEWRREATKRDAEWQAMREAEQAEWHRRHADVLRSPRWKKMCTLVRDRAKGICEACDDSALHEIHHLTYMRLGEELLSDLLGVCRPCHLRIHGREDEIPW